MENIRPIDEKFYGRIKSRKLTARQENLYQTLMPKISIKAFNEIHNKDFRNVYLEIGFGSGEHIAKMALDNPDDLFIGCEPFVNGVASLLVKIDKNNIKNIMIYQADARAFLKTVPSQSLSGVFLLFPDPWAKRKHIKRRFLQDKTIVEIYDKLVNDGFWRLASDHKEYKSWILKLFNQNKFKNFFTINVFTKENRPDIEKWPETRYERKAVDDILYAECVKIDGGIKIEQEQN